MQDGVRRHSYQCPTSGFSCGKQQTFCHVILIYYKAINISSITSQTCSVHLHLQYVHKLSVHLHVYNMHTLRDAPLYIWGGELEFLVLANFFFTSERRQSFFWQSTSNNFFLCFVEEIFCRMLPLLCRSPFGVFSGQHIFHKFRLQTFFLPTFSTNFFFLTFVATNYFFHFFF